MLGHRPYHCSVTQSKLSREPWSLPHLTESGVSNGHSGCLSGWVAVLLVGGLADAAAAAAASPVMLQLLWQPPLLPSNTQSMGLLDLWTPNVHQAGHLSRGLSIYLLMNHYRTAGTLLTFMTNDWTALDL